MMTSSTDDFDLEKCGRSLSTILIGDPRRDKNHMAQTRRMFAVLSVFLVVMQVYTFLGFSRATAMNINCEDTVAEAADVASPKYDDTTLGSISTDFSSHENDEDEEEEVQPENEEDDESRTLIDSDAFEDQEIELPQEPTNEGEDLDQETRQHEETGATEQSEGGSRDIGQDHLPSHYAGPRLAPIGSTSIRKWGCGRNEAPFIFVHIGKAGGGGVRARLAASALYYHRDRWYDPNGDKTYHYPIKDDEGVLHKGKFVNSMVPNFLPRFEDEKESHPFKQTFAFEGQVSCHATTPLGHAIACPFERNVCKSHRGAADDPRRCDIVYVGHNALGSEMHWLPTTFLSEWWNGTMWAHNDTLYNPEHSTVANKLANRFQRSHRVFDRNLGLRRGKMCPDGETSQRGAWKKYYEKCLYPEVEVADAAAQIAISNQHHFAQVYASLPVIRVTMLREPWGWLKSKFFWQSKHQGKYNRGIVLPFKGQDHMERAKRTWSPEQRKEYQGVQFVHCDDEKEMVLGWGKQYAVDYISYLCGEHCMGKWQSIAVSHAPDPDRKRKEELRYLKYMEEQAAYNLRNSFAVVGLLTETMDFFKMISKRVSYMDTSLNPSVRGDTHSSGKGEEMLRCDALYKQESFRSKIMKESPEIAALMRLYELGVEVNKFQKEELKQCTA